MYSKNTSALRRASIQFCLSLILKSYRKTVAGLVVLALCSVLPAFGATITVLNTNDSGAGSLRQAIAYANPLGGDTIDFNLTYPGTITLTTGQLVIDKNLTITGPGAADLAISGANSWDNSFRVFQISSGRTVTISGLTIENGKVDGDGGGIYNAGTLTLTHSTVSGNSAYYGGGGILNDEAGTLTLTHSTVSGNSAGSGGGIYNYVGTLTLTHSTVSGNSAYGFGGGIVNDSSGTLTLTNSTLSGNSAYYGGGILNWGTLTLTHSTLSGNSASSGGGGISNFGTLTIKNTIVANHPLVRVPGEDPVFTGGNCLGGGASLGHNLSDDGTCSGFFTVAGDLNNTPAGLDPSGLQNNGGPTETHALLAGSAAIDAVPNADCTTVAGTPIATDQRGVVRPQGSACDIGAYELAAVMNTPPGTGVSVNPSGFSSVTVTFSGVTAGGDTTLTTSGTGQEAPAGFRVGSPPTYYDISTTAVFSGLVTVCINYTGISFGNESALKLFHEESGVWVDRTIPPPDTENNIICAEVSSFSLFAIFQLETAPVITSVNGPTDPVAFGNPVEITATFTDADLNDAHTCSFSWGDGSSSAGTVMEPTTSSPGECTASHTYSAAGVYEVGISVTDSSGVSDSKSFQFVVIYNPDGGFVTGGGWIQSQAGFCSLNALCASAAGKANFGFVSKYLRGATIPTGQTQFQFKAGNLNFHSSSYEWLVVSGARAQYKGTGTINGAGNYGFMLTAIDGQVTGGGGVDRFRIKITGPGGGVYDNQPGGGDNDDPTTALGGGSIVIHAK